MVKGGDLLSESCQFQYRHWILDAHFNIYLFQNLIFCLKRPKIIEKEAEDGPSFFCNNQDLSFLSDLENKFQLHCGLSQSKITF